MKTTALIVAAGSGRRMRRADNKIFLEIAAKPVIGRTLTTFLASPLIDQVVLVIRPCDEARLKQLLPADIIDQLTVVYGGASRTDSVAAGFAAVATDSDYVLIHDAARPFVGAALIEQIVDQLKQSDAVIPVMPLSDTVKVVAAGRVVTTPPRASLRAVQTPQAFSYQLFERMVAFSETASQPFSDDASIAEALGRAVDCIAGEATNIKITTGQDLLLAELIARSLED